MNTQTITLDISKQAAQTPVVTIGQCDSSGTTIKAKVYDNGIAADLDGMDAMFEMRLPDGKSYVRDGNCTVSGNEITYVVDEEHCAAVEGHSDECYFDILDGPSVIYSTARFRVVVMRSAHNASIEAMPWDSEVDELIARGDAYMDYVEQYGIPAMSSTVRGGAMLGSGLAIADEALSVDPITSAQIDSVAADSSMTGAQSLSLTGLTRLWAKAKAAFAAMTHLHSASDITSGTLGVARGGTGKSDVPSMLADLASENAVSPYDATPRPGVTGLLPVAHGGTGASTAAAARANLDAAQSENAAGSLADAEQAIADNAAAIAALGESVSQHMAAVRVVGEDDAGTVQVHFIGENNADLFIAFRPSTDNANKGNLRAAYKTPQGTWLSEKTIATW